MRKRKILGVATCFSFIFIFHILNFNNINITNSLLQLNGNGNSDVIINNPQRVDVIPNNAGDFFVFSTDNSLTKISCLAKECIESNQSVTSTQINSKYIDAKVIDNDIYLLIIIDEKTRQIVKSSFSGAEGTFSTETTVTFTFPDDSQVSSFCVAKDILFFVDSGKLLFFDMSNTSGAVELKDAVNSISVDFSGDYLYVINKDKTISFCSVDAIKNASKTTVSSLIFGNVTLNGGIDLANNPVNFLSNNIFTDSTGRFYKITGDETSREISILLEVDTSSINI
ncbi:MAG: hypothetical protein IJ758_02780 [Clostridia bacterium]|nr:hypothetical protein [Clostridia bacterium]